VTAARPPGEPGGPAGREQRRRRREQVFDDVLPDHTTDESDEGEPAEPARGRDDWLRDQVPPHHG
jgi:hypothetical protein